MPPHGGHRYVVDFARAWADALTLVLLHQDDDVLPLRQREAWLAELFPAAQLLTLTVEARPDFDLATALSARLTRPVDVVFGSDEADIELAQSLGVGFLPVDPERQNVPISAAAVREDVLASWEFLPACVRPHYVKRICIFGPRHSGKTSLGEQLAVHYDTVCAFEYRATYASANPGRAQPADLFAIARGQLAVEDAMARQANRVLFCDSSAMAMVIDAQARFKRCDDALTALAAGRRYDVHLLMDVDGGWAMGLAREPAQSARRAFERYRQALIESGWRYLRLDGDYDTRFRIACDAVDNLLGQPTARPPRPELV